MAISNNKREFLDKYKKLCLKHDCYIEGCGCNLFINSIKKEIEYRRAYYFDESVEGYDFKDGIKDIFEPLKEYILNENTE